MPNSLQISLSFEREQELTSLQLQCSQLIRSFCQEAIHPTSLATFLIGGTIFPFARAKAFQSLSSLCGIGRISHYSSLAIATGLEGFSFCLTPKLLQRAPIDFDSFTPEAAHSVATIAVLKGIAPLFGGNLILTQLTQSVCLVGVNRAFGASGLIEHPSQEFLYELVAAEVTSFQSGVTGSLLKMTFPQATWISAQCEIEYKVSKTPLFSPKASHFFSQFSPLRKSANEAPSQILSEHQKTEVKKMENRHFMANKRGEDGIIRPEGLPFLLNGQRRALIAQAAQRRAIQLRSQNKQNNPQLLPEETALPEREIILLEPKQKGKKQSHSLNRDKTDKTKKSDYKKHPEVKSLTTLGAFLKELREELCPEGRDAFCRKSGIDDSTAVEIEFGRTRPTLEVLYKFISFFQQEGGRRRDLDQKLHPATFYEKYQPEVLLIPNYDPKTKRYRADLTLEKIEDVFETPVALYLKNELKKRKWKRADLARESTVPLNRVNSLLDGSAYQLEFSEIIALAKALNEELDIFYLRVRKPRDFLIFVSNDGQVLRSPATDFSKLSPPTQFRKPNQFGSTLKKLKEEWKIKTDQELADLLNMKLPTLKEYFRGIGTPHLIHFYEICAVVREQSKKRGKPKKALIQESAVLYLARTPDAESSGVIDSQGRVLKIILPKNEEREWSYERLRNTSFGGVLSEIISEARRLNLTHQSSDNKTFSFSGRALAKALKVSQPYIDDLIQNRVLDIPWSFIQKVADFSRESLNGKFDISFLAASANPILYDLAEKVVDGEERILRPADYEEPFSLTYRYHNRMNYKGSKGKAS